MGRKIKAGTKGESAQYFTRGQALKKLQISLASFRRLCILKGIYPRDPKKKKHGKDKVYYHNKDIVHLMYEPLLEKFRRIKIHTKKVNKAVGRRDLHKAKALSSSCPKYTLHHIIKERYPSLAEAVHDLDDTLSIVSIFAALPVSDRYSIKGSHIAKSIRILDEFLLINTYIKSLRKVFISIKGYYFQIQIFNQNVTWLFPHQFPHDMPEHVDMRVMQTFWDLSICLLQLLNYKMYVINRLGYPPLYAMATKKKKEKTKFVIEGIGTSLFADKEIEQKGMSMFHSMKIIHKYRRNNNNNDNDNSDGNEQNENDNRNEKVSINKSSKRSQKYNEYGSKKNNNVSDSNDENTYECSDVDNNVIDTSIKNNSRQINGTNTKERNGASSIQDPCSDDVAEDFSSKGDVHDDSEVYDSDINDNKKTIDVMETLRKKLKKNENEAETEKNKSTNVNHINNGGVGDSSVGDHSRVNDSECINKDDISVNCDTLEKVGRIYDQDEHENLSSICGVNTHPVQALFEGLTFFLCREIPLVPFLFMLKSCGVKTVGWQDLSSPIQPDDPSITHFIVDKPPQFILRDEEGTREYVQPQWIADSINCSCLLPIHLYAPGKIPPPHLSPFVDDEEVGYVPKQREILDRLIQKARKTGQCVSSEDVNQQEDDDFETEEKQEKFFADIASEVKEELNKDNVDANSNSVDENRNSEISEINPQKDGIEILKNNNRNNKKGYEKRKEEEYLSRKALMPKKHRRLLDRIEFGDRQRKEKAEILCRKRKHIEMQMQRKNR